MTIKQIRLLKALNFSILDFFKRKKKENKKPIDNEEEYELDEESPTPNDEIRWFLEDIKSIIEDKFKIKQINIYYDTNVDKVAKIYTKYYDTVLKQTPAMYKKHEQWWKKMLPKCTEMHAERFGLNKYQVLPWGGINIGITLINNKDMCVSFESTTFDNTCTNQRLYFVSRFNGNGQLISQQVEC